MSLRDTAASSSPAPTDIATAIAWWDSREKNPATAPTSSPIEETAPQAKAPQMSVKLGGMVGAFVDGELAKLDRPVFDR